jgi:hypothetical protein
VHHAVLDDADGRVAGSESLELDGDDERQILHQLEAEIRPQHPEHHQ